MFQGGTSEASEVSVLDVRDLSDGLGVLVGALEPDDVPLPDAFPMWQELQMVSRLAGAAATLMVRKVDESGVWRREGFRTVDDFLAHHSGTTTNDARKKRTASEQLKDLPDTRDQFQSGNLSEDQAREISDAATTNPDAEKKLLDDAAKKKSLKDLKENCGRAKTAADRNPDDTDKRIRTARKLTNWSDPDGSNRFYGIGPVDDAAILTAALEPIINNYYQTRKGTPEQAERHAYAWDALVELARQSLTQHQPPPPASTADTERDPDTETTPPKQPAVPPYLGILRADLSALVRGWVEGDELCEIVGLGQVPVTRARELLGESTLRLVLTNGIDVQNVTYLGRGANAAQKIALLWSQPICTNITCGRTQRLENDHRQPYSDVHVTELANLDPCCEHDHDLKTYEGWAFVGGTGRRPLVPPHDPRHPKNAPPPDNPPDDGPEPPDDTPELFPDTS